VYPECHPEVSGEKGLVFGPDKRYGILVQTGQGILYINRMQLQSKKALDWQAFLNGNRTLVGSLLGGNE
jgi:methionyl-tRNA formyltransferase